MLDTRWLLQAIGDLDGVRARLADDREGHRREAIDPVVAGMARAAGTLVGKAGNEHTMMTVGLGVVGSTYSFASDYRLLDATPLRTLGGLPTRFEGIDLVVVREITVDIYAHLEHEKINAKLVPLRFSSNLLSPSHQRCDRRRTECQG